MYNQPYAHHGRQQQHQKLPSLHHLMLPSPQSNYSSKLLPPPQPLQSSYLYPINTSNNYSSTPLQAPRTESFDSNPRTVVPSDDQVLNDASLLFFRTSCCSNTIPHQFKSFISPPPLPSPSLSSPIPSSSSSSLLHSSSVSSSAAAGTTPPFKDFVLFESHEQRGSSSALSSLSPPCKAKLVPDLNVSSSYFY